MASQSYPTLGFGLLQELGTNDIIKSRACVVNLGGRKHDLILETSFNLKPHLLEPLEPFCSLSKSNHFVEFDSTMMKPRLIGVHETRPEPLCLSLGIAEKCARQEKVTEFLLSRSEELKEGGFDMSLLSELMDLEAFRSSSQLPYASSSLLYLDGSIFLSSSRAEFNDLVSTAAEFHNKIRNNSTRWRKLSRLVPQFQRIDSEVLTDTLQLPAAKLDSVTLAPPESPKKTRLKPSPKKQNPKIRDKETDLYKRNHLHACESLISLMIGDEQHRQTTILSLKKSRGELLELLTQFSIGFAGTGIAVLFSLVCSVASRRVPFCANKVFESALSLSLVLLSWSVSRLREAIVDVNKKAIKEEEITYNVERRIKEVYFRTATVIAMVALRFG
ncbi:PREDICTED: uncharacterized protein LOC104760621 isoform X3 [Camelina sativa]|uniref:Uncharacterized protein LOC104760621 isoform X3 n=1 Tax=Camelina sativa TaxID=90675 RepID=A0ABM0X7J6_CAMSA|nr:PREDICTED: uncharacterized protein LOC104760621 isoform X3 [Camelina sativa]